MKTFFSEKEEVYDGSQLRSLFAYQTFDVLGDSIVSWVGPCKVSNEHMVDGEDLFAGEKIEGSKMLHFIVEKFDCSLLSAVGMQRLFAELIITELRKSSSKKEINQFLERKGDDIYFENRKLNISIATQSPTSSMIHFAVNISNEGAPVPTLSLEELQVDQVEFAHNLMEHFSNEVESMVRATQKVFWVK